MIAGAQIRAARALLNWSVAVLAKRCGLSQSIIRHAESVDGRPTIDAERLAVIKAALTAGGVQFIETVGVKLPKVATLAIPVDQLNASNDQ
jgi:transcriptional regulator with XRE-family HTH domain